ncbi:flagellar protein FliT [Chitinilyticum aquatile]|uniref:flagellar protein FliT n=1 Tax=Chitinilyticum aquatile TaxID=362520 RepID=UPI0003FCD98C|nr:flagellar protein FliT [Chitinilyticum aquatile]
MAASDKVRFEELLDMLQQMRQQLDEEAWDDTIEKFPALSQALQAISNADLAAYPPPERQKLAILAQSVQDELQFLMPHLEAWRQETQQILQSMNNQGKLQRTYRT